LYVDLRDYYDRHWTEVPEGQVDYSRLQQVLDVLEPGERVLDSGCGPGFLAKLLADHGVNVVGTDVSAVGPERTRARGIDARQAGLQHIELRGHAGTWVRGLYPRLLVNRYTKELFDRIYEPLVRLRPSLFARYLCFYAVKETA